MAKRPKSTRTKPVDEKLLSPKVKAILRHLEFIYALGTEALARTKQHQADSPNGKPNSKTPTSTRSSKRQVTRTRYASRVIRGLAKERDVHFNTVETARRIAKVYAPNYFRQLIRRGVKKGLPLTANHLAQLSFVEDPKPRATFEEQALDNNWSVRELAAAIAEDKLKHGHAKATVGKKPVIPKTLPGIVRQIIEYCDKWRRWSGTFSEEIEADGELRPKLKDIQRRLASLDDEIDKIHRMAGALVATKEAKQFHNGSRKNRRPRKESLREPGASRVRKRTGR